MVLALVVEPFAADLQPAPQSFSMLDLEPQHPHDEDHFDSVTSSEGWICFCTDALLPVSGGVTD